MLRYARLPAKTEFFIPLAHGAGADGSLLAPSSGLILSQAHHSDPLLGNPNLTAASHSHLRAGPFGLKLEQVLKGLAGSCTPHGPVGDLFFNSFAL